MKYDAILIPGGGVNESGEPTEWVKERLDLAARVYNELRGTHLITLSGMTCYKPPVLGHKGFPIFESAAGANYLTELGVDPKRILTEIISHDTIGDFFFARVVHVEPREFRRLLTITSEFHMQRARTVCEWIFGLEPITEPFELNFKEVPNKGLGKKALTSRIEKEGKRLEHLRSELIPRIHSLEELHRWIYTEHGAYAFSLKPEEIDEILLESY